MGISAKRLKEIILEEYKSLTEGWKKKKYKKSDYKKYNKLVKRGKSVMVQTAYGDEFAWEDGSSYGVFGSEEDGREIELDHDDIDIVMHEGKLQEQGDLMWALDWESDIAQLINSKELKMSIKSPNKKIKSIAQRLRKNLIQVHIGFDGLKDEVRRVYGEGKLTEASSRVKRQIKNIMKYDHIDDLEEYLETFDIDKKHWKVISHYFDAIRDENMGIKPKGSADKSRKELQKVLFKAIKEGRTRLSPQRDLEIHSGGNIAQVFGKNAVVALDKKSMKELVKLIRMNMGLFEKLERIMEGKSFRLSNGVKVEFLGKMQLKLTNYKGKKVILDVGELRQFLKGAKKDMGVRA